MSKVLFNEMLFLPYLKKYIYFRKFLYTFYESDYLLFFSQELSQFNMSFKECTQKYESEYKKFLRAFKRVKLICNNYDYVYFLTLTFNDLYILDHVKCFNKFKRSLSYFCYLGNIDYGSSSERVHYHMVLGSSISLTKDNFKWLYGFFDVKRVNNKNTKALSKYIVKLSNHARKQNLKLIYSRLNKN